MQVKLNAFRDGRRPGDVVDVSDADGATLIEHGAAFPVDDVNAETDKADTPEQTVSGSAVLQAASDAEAPAP